MHPRLLFWIPTLIRAVLVLLGAAVLWRHAGLVAALGALLAVTATLVFVQLLYLDKLSAWLERPDSKLPDGWGAWTDIYARLYRMRREDQRNRQELSEWLARFRQAMHLLPDGVVIMDDVLFLEWCNPAAEKHLGLTLERDRTMRVTNLVRSPDFMDYIILGRYEQPLTLSLRGRKLIVHVIPFENRRQILVTHDVTEAERIDMMRRDFIANASHELRTPLTVIIGFLEIASGQSGLDEATRRAHLKLMSEQAHRMQNLVEDMLTLSRLESSDHPFRPEHVPMRPLLEGILEEARALSGGRHTVTLEVRAGDIKGNGEELRSAFGNLVSNAIRYTPEGGAIAIAWRESQDGPQFSVRDSGIGIAPEHLGRLTERFYRVDKSRSRQSQGTGLGLAIVKHVLLRHGGQLAIASQPGAGSTFTAQLPPYACWVA